MDLFSPILLNNEIVYLKIHDIYINYACSMFSVVVTEMRTATHIFADSRTVLRGIYHNPYPFCTLNLWNLDFNYL